MNILIPNGAGTKNLGDLAIHEGLISLLKKSKNKIVVHSFDADFTDKSDKVNPNIYYWAVFNDRRALVRLERMFWVLVALVFPRQIEKVLPWDLRKILGDYKWADRVILKGGGYFRSRRGFTQQVNAVMNCLYILFAKKYSKSVIIRPISFGPFSNKFTEWICAKSVGLADSIYARDRVSFKLLQKYISKRKLFEQKDEAFLKKPIKVTRNEDKTLGFTVREWVKKSKREVFLHNMATLIEKSATDKNCLVIQPVIQVDAPEYNEGDEKITKDLSSLLKERGLKVGKPLKPKNVKDALGVYGKLSHLVGMRMHSCIFAHIQKVSFTAVAYEHKHSLLEKFADDVISVNFLQSGPKKDKKVAYSKRVVYNKEAL